MLENYLKSAVWIFSEQLVKIFSLIFVGIYIARYLGPEGYGELSYSMAIVAVFLSVSKLGMESVLVRELSNISNDSKEYMGAAFYLMSLGALISFLCLATFSIYETELNLKFYILILSLGLLFQPLLVVDYFFQATANGKYSAIVKTLCLIVFSLIKIWLVKKSADLFWIVVAFSAEQAFIGMYLALIYKIKYKSFWNFAFKKIIFVKLFSSAWPMVLSGIAGVLLVRIDQIMIKNMLSVDQVGVYSAAAKIYEGWLVLPFIVSISLLPVLSKLRLKNYDLYLKSFKIIFSAVIWMSIAFSILITIFGRELILITFGKEYIASYNILVILCWASVFGSIGYVSARYLIVEGMEKTIATRNWIALAINIPLNLVLINLFGVEGAAISTLICLIFAHYFIDFIDPKLKNLRSIKFDALICNWK